MTRPLESEVDYRRALAEIRRLRGLGATAESDPRLAACEAAAADWAERLRASAETRPPASPPAGTPARTRDAPVREPSIGPGRQIRHPSGSES